MTDDKAVADEKLIELIEEYGNCRANEGTTKCLVQQGGFSAKKGIIIARTNGAKAKQAIIDYHNKKIQEATKPIRAVWEKYEFGRLHIAPYNEILMVLRDVKQALKQTIALSDSEGIKDDGVQGGE